MGYVKNLASRGKLCPLPVKEQGFAASRKSLLLYAAVAVFAGWCLVTFHADVTSISFDPIWQARNAICLATLLSMANYFLRILRWSVYLNRFGFRFPAGFTGLSYVAGFAFTLSPGKVGEMIRARYYKEAGVPLNVTTAAFFVERLMDTFAMAGLALIGFAASTGYASILCVSIGGMLVLLAILAATPWEKWQARLAHHQRMAATLSKTLDGILRTLVSARGLLRPRLLVFGFVLGLLAWGAEGTGLMVLGGLVPSVPIDWTTANGIYAIAVLIGAASFLPGGLGSTEVVMATLLAAHGYAMPQAILITMVCRILTLWLAVMIGWSAVFVLRHYPEQASIKS